MLWIVLIAIVAAFLFWVWRKPDDFSISRQTSINALPQDIFGWINNLKRYNEWNPWAASDPTSVTTYNDIEEGPGASCSWSGKKTGQGSMTISDQKQPNEVNMALHFKKPFEARNVANYTITEGNGVTVVVWTMSGKSAFSHKLMQTFFSMDKMVGNEFEKGLATLKAMVEQKKLN
jgi:hypothetical protein